MRIGCCNCADLASFETSLKLASETPPEGVRISSAF